MIHYHGFLDKWPSKTLQIDFPGENIGLIHTKTRNLNSLQHKIYTRKCNTHKHIQAKDPNKESSTIPHHTIVSQWLQKQGLYSTLRNGCFFVLPLDVTQYCSALYFIHWPQVSNSLLCLLTYYNPTQCPFYLIVFYIKNGLSQISQRTKNLGIFSAN